MRTIRALFALPLVASLLVAVTAHAQEAADAPVDWGLTAWGLLSTVVYGAVGIVLAMLGYKLFDLIVPFSVEKELAEDDNPAVGIVVGSVIIGVSIIVAASIH